MNIFQQYIAKSRYARFLPDKKRREHFDETINRYISFIFETVNEKYSLNDNFSKEELDFLLEQLTHHISTLQVMPSMRGLMTAGKAASRDNTCVYNCAYLPIDDIKAFDEAMFILMCGTGVGFSVERQNINQLPEIPEKLFDSDTSLVVKDSKEGWAKSLRMLLALLYSGEIPKWDISKIRAAGSPLKTFGGRASGGQVLEDLFIFIIKIFKNAKGRKLTSLECHDIMCKIAEIVVVGGVRRSALISLSNLSDERMRHAKDGQWWNGNAQRALSNNSAVYTEKPEVGIFLQEWLSLYESKSGERGIFSRDAAKKVVTRNGRREVEHAWGCNPCSEILLRPYEFCNLSEVVVRVNDTEETLIHKIKIATILGTFQSTFTHFPYLRKIWQKNTEEERLLGVSLTGIYDNHLMNCWQDQGLPERLERLKQVAIDTNKEWAEKLGINQSTAITTVKPSGCRSRESLVTTNQGILRLDEFEYGDKWKDIKDYDGEYGKIQKTFVNGIDDIIEIELSYGMKLRSTPNHKWMVLNKGWTRTDELKENDQLMINIQSYNKIDDLELSVNTKILHFNCKTDINLPKYLNSNFGWLLGYISGDGAMCSDKSRFRFTDGFEPSIKKAKNIFNDLFNINGNIRQLNDRNAYALEIASQELWNFFEENNLIKDYLKIPLPVRKSSKETIIAFLAGLLDSDGYAKNGRIMWTTAIEEYADHIQQIGWSVGLVISKSENSQRKNSYSKKSMWLLYLSWGHSSSDSKELLKKHSIKMKDWKEPITNSRSAIYKMGNVKSIKNIGKHPTFDIETETHWFWAGAFMSHNTVSTLVDCASGIHPRHSKFYYRRVRSDNKDPLTKFLIDIGIPNEPDIMKPGYTTVFTFPIKAPENSLTKDDISAIDHLELWKIYANYYCEHKPSVTISVKEHEWPRIGAWVYDHFDEISGVSFLPFNGGTYKQAPFESITKEQYEKMLEKMPTNINWDNLIEGIDNVEGVQTLACSGGGCEV